MLSKSRRELLCTLLESSRPETSPLYALVQSLSNRSLQPTKAPTRTQLVQLLVDSPDAVDVFDNASRNLLAGNTQWPFRVSMLAQRTTVAPYYGQTSRSLIANHAKGLLSVVTTQTDGKPVVIELDLRTNEKRNVVVADQVIHLSYPFADLPILAIVYRQHDTWFAMCGTHAVKLPMSPEGLVMGMDRPIYHWEWWENRPRLGISAMRCDKVMIWDGTIAQTRSSLQRMQGFLAGEPQFSRSACHELILIDGQRFDLDVYSRTLTDGYTELQLFDGITGNFCKHTPSNHSAFISLCDQSTSSVTALIEPMVDNGWNLSLRTNAVPGIPQSVHVAPDGQRLLLATEMVMCVLNRSGGIVRTLAARDRRSYHHDRNHGPPFRIYETGNLLLIAQGGWVRPLPLRNIMQQPGTPLPLYREVAARPESLLLHDNALHTLATCQGGVYSFRWPLR